TDTVPANGPALPNAWMLPLTCAPFCVNARNHEPDPPEWDSCPFHATGVVPPTLTSGGCAESCPEGEVGAVTGPVLPAPPPQAHSPPTVSIATMSLCMIPS